MSHLLLEEAGAVAIVRLNRPEARNALSNALMTELIDVAHGFAKRTDIHVVVLSGGRDYFSAGADLKDPARAARAKRTLLERRSDVTIGPRLCKAWEALEQVTIVAIEGFCIGGGVALAAACDFRIAGAGASFRLPEIPLGMNMSWGALPRLTALIGPARTKKLALFGEAVSAEEAREWGLVDALSPTGGAEAEALIWAEKLAALPPLAVRITKEAVNAASAALHPVSAFADRDQFLLATGTQDAAEGVAAFLEKRKARFTGD